MFGSDRAGWGCGGADAGGVGDQGAVAGQPVVVDRVGLGKVLIARRGSRRTLRVSINETGLAQMV